MRRSPYLTGSRVLWAGALLAWLLALATGSPAKIGAATLVVGWFAARPRLARRASGGADRPAPQPVDQPSDEPVEVGDLIEQMLGERRYALLLRPELTPNLDRPQFDRAWEALHDSMALVPEGDVVVGFREATPADPEEQPGFAVRVEALYLDRCAVTNADFQAFVDAGGYEQLALWDPEILPGLMHFVDQTGRPGPRYWREGRHPAGKARHPVVGVSWYEAGAYARWVGKRLPSDPEWEKAASWPAQISAAARSQRRYPWGEVMDRGRCQLWGSGAADTVPVDALAEGTSVGGVLQLVGNVWEWTTGNYGAWSKSRPDLLLPVAMKSIRGGAFDTYFEHQATCQFQSGEDPLARKHNIGFRCALGICDIDWRYAAGGPPDEEAESSAAAMGEAGELASPVTAGASLGPESLAARAAPDSETALVEANG